ncbi:ead/Ea22-like family protein [Pseudomonas aeruginosa]|uniref:ead/Ea22-like family protein n=1 Tax=Pseudomonas aeruginosa TaxID=287 RepID=UPI003671BA48
MTDHAELRRVAEAATPGPWSCNRHRAIVGGPTFEFTNGAAQQQIAMACWQSWMHEEELRNNAEFIAAANPKTILALLDEIDRLKAENEALRGALKPFAEFERVRSAMGGNAPREGILYGVHSNTGSAELHVEHMQTAQSALEGATQ